MMGIMQKKFLKSKMVMRINEKYSTEITMEKNRDKQSIWLKEEITYEAKGSLVES